MAKIFPELKDFTNIPYAEKLVYEFLKNLGDEFTVFYSVQWCNSYRKWNTTWKENDFLILHKKRGILVLEIKGGDIQIENGKLRALNTMVVGLIIIGVFVSMLTSVDISRLGKQWNREFIVMRFGIYTYQINDVIASLKPQISPLFGYDEKAKEFREFYENRDECTRGTKN